MLNRLSLLNLSSRLAEELPKLVDKQRWYERPDVLKLAEIPTLISMECVTEVMASHEKAFGERVAALATVLRKMFTDGGHPPELARDALIYLGLDDEHRRALLWQRREVIAERRGVSSERFRRQEEFVLRGLIASHIAAYENQTDVRARFFPERSPEEPPEFEIYELLNPPPKMHGAVFEYDTLSELKDAPLEVVAEAKFAVVCVGCPIDPSMELYAITRKIRSRGVVPGFFVDLVVFGTAGDLRDLPDFPVAAPYGEPNLRLTFVPVRFPFGPLLLGNEDRCFLCLPPVPDLQHRGLNPTVVAVEAGLGAFSYATAMAGGW